MRRSGSDRRARPTIKEIAAATGVSVRVVAAVLAGDVASTVGYSAATREKVLAAAERLGYQRNRTARWLRLGRHGALGVVVQTEHVIPVEIMEAMLVAARERGLFVVQDRTPPGEQPMFLEEDSVDGLICFSELDEASMARIRARRLPVVWVNTDVRRGGNVITYDERGGAREAVRHLKERGWERVGVVAWRHAHYSVRERIAGVRSIEASAPVFYTDVQPWEHGVGYEQVVEEMGEFLRRHAGVNGLVVTNALLVPGLYRALRRVGRVAGRDIGVVTFEWQEVSVFVEPRVTAMELNLSEIGFQAVAMIERLISGQETERYVAPYRLVERETTRGVG
ncbi:MAG: LacI family transcriptional regulator [bacterium]|nr:LacI family transcriptional regulator [bacterium]